MDPRIRTLRHDLRGQLNSIMLCSSVLSITADPAEIIQFLDEIILASDKAMNLLDQIEALPPEAFDGANAPGA